MYKKPVATKIAASLLFQGNAAATAPAADDTHREQCATHKHNADTGIEQRQRLRLIDDHNVDVLQRGMWSGMTLRPQRNPQAKPAQLRHKFWAPPRIPWGNQGEQLGNRPLWMRHDVHVEGGGKGLLALVGVGGEPAWPASKADLQRIHRGGGRALQLPADEVDGQGCCVAQLCAQERHVLYRCTQHQKLGRVLVHGDSTQVEVILLLLRNTIRLYQRTMHVVCLCHQQGLLPHRGFQCMDGSDRI